ncbi:MAG: MFS transporter, partial [Lentisphaerae bacterium]|nr:MFS transporter [Lentisphaerota bacterium]
VFRAAPWQIGALAATWSVFYITGCLVIRPLFKRMLPRYSIIFSILSMSVLSLGMGLSPSLLMLFPLHALYGLAMSMFWPPLVGWLSTDTEGARLGRVVNLFNLGWCTGGIVSPPICGWLSQVGPRLPLLVGSGLYLLTAVFIAGAIAVLPKVRADRGFGADSHEEGSGPDRSSRLRFPAWVGLFAAFFGYGIVRNIFPVVARESLDFAKSMIGVLFMGMSLVNALTFVVLGRTQFWHFKAVPMLAGQALAAVAFAGMAFAGSFWANAVLLSLIGISFGLSYSNSIFHGASGSRNRAHRMAIHESVLAAGAAIGPVVGGLVLQHHGAAPVYGVCAGLMLVSAGVQAFLSRPAEPPPHTIS